MARTLKPAVGWSHLAPTHSRRLGAGLLPAVFCSPEEPAPGKSFPGDTLYKILSSSLLPPTSLHQPGSLPDTSAAAPASSTRRYCCEDFCKVGKKLASGTSSPCFQFQKLSSSQFCRESQCPLGFSSLLPKRMIRQGCLERGLHTQQSSRAPSELRQSIRSCTPPKINSTRGSTEPTLLCRQEGGSGSGFYCAFLSVPAFPLHVECACPTPTALNADGIATASIDPEE